MRFRVETTVEAAELPQVIAELAKLGPAYTVIARIEEFPQPTDVPQGTATAGVQTATAKHVSDIHDLHPPKKTKHVGKKGNGGDWPPKGGIYATVLDALREGPRTPNQLREVLAAKDFSPGSVNSALGRLEKAGKARKGGAGTWEIAA
jgi:hypothetical protein